MKNNKEIIKLLDYKDMDKGLDIVNKNKVKQAKEEIKKTRLNKTKIESTNISRNLKLLFFIFVIMILVLIVFFIYKYSIYFGYFLNEDKRISLNEEFISNDNEYIKYNNEILMYNNEKIMTINSNGKKTFEKTFEIPFMPDIYVNDKYMAIVNKSTSSITMYSNKREISVIKIDGVISEVYVQKNGNIVTVYSKGGYKKILSIKDIYGRELYTIYLDNEVITDVILFENNKKMIIVELDTSSITIGTKIKYVNLETDEKVTDLKTFDNKLVVDVIKKQDNIYLVFNDEILKYNYTNNTYDVLYDLNSTQTNYVNLRESYYSLIETLETTNLRVINFNNKEISKIKLEYIPYKFLTSKFLNYVVYDKEIQIINKWGKKIKEISVNYVPNEVLLLNEGKTLVLIYSNNIDIIDI